MAVAAAVAAAPLAMRATHAGGAHHRVDIKHLQFVAAETVVMPGDTVLWINRDLVPHTITAEDGSWDSGPVRADGTWELPVTGETSRKYFCRYHPTMRGQLGVGRVEKGDGNDHAR